MTLCHTTVVPSSLEGDPLHEVRGALSRRTFGRWSWAMCQWRRGRPLEPLSLVGPDVRRQREPSLDVVPTSTGTRVATDRLGDLAGSAVASGGAARPRRIAAALASASAPNRLAAVVDVLEPVGQQVQARRSSRSRRAAADPWRMAPAGAAARPSAPSARPDLVGLRAAGRASRGPRRGSRSSRARNAAAPSCSAFQVTPDARVERRRAPPARRSSTSRCTLPSRRSASADGPGIVLVSAAASRAVGPPPSMSSGRAGPAVRRTSRDPSSAHPCACRRNAITGCTPQVWHRRSRCRDVVSACSLGGMGRQTRESLMHRKLAALVLAATSIGVVASVSPASQAAKAATEPLRYVALGDSYSAASGCPAPGSDLAVLPAFDAELPARHRAADWRRPHGRVLRRGRDQGFLHRPAPGRPSTARRPEAGHPARHHDDRRQRQRRLHQHHPVRAEPKAFCHAGQGSPCKDKYGDSFEDTIRNKTYPDLVKALSAVHQRSPGAEVAILGLPVDHTTDKGLLRQDADRDGRRPLRPPHPVDAERRRTTSGRRHRHHLRELNQVSEGHDACKPIGVRWIEPVAQGTNPVVVRPNALGEAQMLGRSHNASARPQLVRSRWVPLPSAEGASNHRWSSSERSERTDARAVAERATQP